MPKNYDIRLEVEEIALGAVLRKLNETPGIVRLHLDLERGGEGAGRKQLENHAAQKRSGDTNPQIIFKMLLGGPKHISDITRAIGGIKASAYTVTSKMRKDGLLESGSQKGTYQLTHKARTQLGVVQALPAPTPSTALKHGPGGRATPGSGDIVLRTVLAEGALSYSDVSKRFGEHGLSPRSATGVLTRAKRNGLIKKNGKGYELTAKGQKIEMGGAAHG